MLKDVTLGQFLPGDSPVHRLDPRAKILLLIAVIVFIFITGNYASLALVAVFVFAVILSTKISLKMYLKSMKMILFIVLFTGIINLFYGRGEPIFELGFIKIT